MEDNCLVQITLGALPNSYKSFYPKSVQSYEMPTFDFLESFCWRSRGVKFNKNGNVQMKHFDTNLEDKLSTNGEVVFLDMDVEVLDKPHALKMETTILKIIIRTHKDDHAIITSATN
jgi:hypothetical protein